MSCPQHFLRLPMPNTCTHIACTLEKVHSFTVSFKMKGILPYKAKLLYNGTSLCKALVCRQLVIQAPANQDA